MSRFKWLLTKRKFEDLLIAPFVWWGRMKAKRNPLPGSYEIFLFFPFYHMGGAEKVHALIAKSLRHKKAIIYFTRKSHNRLFKPLFEESGHTIVDISPYTDNKGAYWNNLVYRGLISQYVHSQKTAPVIFNGQCNFAYKLSRWIRSDIRQIELIHSLNTFSYIRIPFLPFYDQTVMISRKRIEDHYRLYERYGIPDIYKEKIRYIPNGIALPSNVAEKEFNSSKLNLLYAGRTTKEKRAGLAAAVALACGREHIPVNLVLAGPDETDLPENLRDAGQFTGLVEDARQMNAWYQWADVLLVTSTEEGFPLVVMEAMAHGCIIMGTPVGDLSLHVKPETNGYLFSSIGDESRIIKEAVGWCRELLEQPSLRRKIFFNNREYASEHFGMAKFEAAWQQLFETVKSNH